MYLTKKLFPRTFDDKLDYLTRLGHFTSSRYPVNDDGAADSIRQIFRDEKDPERHPRFVDAVESLQRYTGVQVDGVFGEQTVGTARDRCCGSPDILSAGGNYWGLRKLGCWHDMEFPGLDHARVKQIYLSACAMWTAHCNMDIDWIANNSIKPHFYAHAKRIDGKNGTLAWSQLPPANYMGVWLQQRYDFEDWNDQASWVLEALIAHEVGHVLGLPHSRNRDDLMYFRIGNAKEPSAGDIQAIQDLYGVRGDEPGPIEERILLGKDQYEYVDGQRLVTEHWLETV